MTKRLFLADFEGMSLSEVYQHIITEYEAKKEEVKPFDILIAYESVGDYGCDSTSFFLLKHKKTKQFYVNHGSHCSCYGFEGQWEPEETTLEYLKSDHFYFSTGGYDGEANKHEAVVKEYISKLRKPRHTVKKGDVSEK
jgi:hypothetical protein